MPEGLTRKRYEPTFHPDGRKVYNPSRTMTDIHDEWDALTEKVKADDPDCRFPEMRARELWRQQEETAERWSEWQQRVWRPRNRAISQARFDANESERDASFTKAELEHLAEHFAGANDPVAQSILAKVQAALAPLSEKS